MKISIDIDCTPEEARTFLGLPDVGPMQERMLAEMEKRMLSVIERSEPQHLMETWMPVGMKSLEQWQGVWTQFAKAAAEGMTRATAKAQDKAEPAGKGEPTGKDEPKRPEGGSRGKR